ncbi:alpha/beta fold hydrolase [Microbacterium paraoxydans]|uniref:Alpha/beta hydrolase n=1 Tax=Microbacterium paraoxydans TaxID=199592 RepID=A0ABS5IQI0_9MICO|nr:alpha/beta hydrolase [Microbacterium paraoxydans]MBS0025235.1 alpha/beta hydrolase [Microbacterium paraoxydans]
MTPTRTRIPLPGAEVSVCEWTPAHESGIPVLLLHGGGADSAELSWGGIGPQLAAAGHRVIAPDHPGFGRSPRPTWRITQERLVQYVGELEDALGLDDYAIAGLSLGGGLTLGHLIDRPDRARAAALLGCYGVMPRLADGPTGALTHFSTFLLLRAGLLSAMTRSYARNASAMEKGLTELVRTPDARTPELVEAVLTEAASGTGLATFGEWQRDQVRWNRLRTVYTERLPSVHTPTLLVHGDRDSGVPLARIRTAAGLLPDSRLVVVPGAGHWVQRDRPDVVTSALLEHLDRNAHA